jgi:hypothetical protein
MPTQAKLRLKRRIRVALPLVTMILLLVTSSPPPQASAKSGCIWYKRLRHYTDVNYTTLCGVTTYLCNGEVAHGGCWTAYSTVQECECIEE